MGARVEHLKCRDLSLLYVYHTGRKNDEREGNGEHYDGGGISPLVPMNGDLDNIDNFLENWLE